MNISEANKLRVLYFLVFCCTASWLPLFADYLKAHGITEIRTGILLSIPPLMMLSVQSFSGMLADRLGYKKSLLLSSLLATLSYTFYLYDGGFVYLFIVTVFMALFYNSIQPVLDSLSLKLVQDNPKFSYGTLRIAGAVGWALTGIITGYFIDTINTTVIFVISTISMGLTFLVSFSLKPDKTTVSKNPTQSFRYIKEIFTNKTLIFLLICVFLISTGATAIWNYYSIYMKENNASASLVGFGLSFSGLCEIPFFYFSARIIRKLGLRTTLLITVSATVLRLILYSVVKNPVAAIPIELLHGLSWSLFWVVCVEYVNKLVLEDWRATGQSLLYVAYYGIGAIAGNLWTGYLYDTKMKIADIFLINAGIVALVGLSVFLFMKNKTFQGLPAGRQV